MNLCNISELHAGAAEVDITPEGSVHLFGYPHVERMSTGVHDLLYASALCLRTGHDAAIFVGCDIIFIPKDLAASARKRIHDATGAAFEAIVISATHTHSGPDTVVYASNAADATVPLPDTAYLNRLEDSIVESATRAHASAVPAEVAVGYADGSCTGTNRRDPSGPSNPRVPVMNVRTHDGAPIAVMLVCSMHPTVLHEDSTLISGDFPGATRAYLKAHGYDCPIIHHSGASGNQSPRHVISGTTFEEATRIGDALGESVISALSNVEWHREIEIESRNTEVDLALRSFPDAEEAEHAVIAARNRFETLKKNYAPRTEVRTAECDVFGAEETFTLAQSAADGALDEFAARCMPAEIQCITVGPWKYIALPGEFFVEFAIEIESASSNTFVITIANGELQGYIVTQEAVDEGGYEASNALFKSPESGEKIVQAAIELLQ